MSNSYLFDLSTLSVVTLQGAGADKLLQGQTTCDLRQLSLEHSLLGAQCTPKGRTITNFRAVQTSEEETLLVLPADQIDNQINALAKYAPFFKVKVESAQDQWKVFGISGELSEQICDDLLGGLPQNVNDVHASKLGSEEINFVCKIAKQRFIILVKSEQSQALLQQLCQHLAPSDTTQWNLLNIQDGLAEVIADTSEMFIPQMLNLQAVGAISFKKGCYTGQEIVARMHYLGKLKRHMYRLKISGQTLPSAGADCYIADKKQSIGNVVSAASSTEGHIELLAVLTEQGAQASELKFDDGEFQAIKQLALPYSIEKA